MPWATIEEASLASTESKSRREERDDLEACTLDDIVDLSEVGVGTMDIPEGERHHDISREREIRKSVKK